MKFYGGVGRGPRTNRLDFGGDPGLDLDPGSLKTDHDPVLAPALGLYERASQE